MNVQKKVLQVKDLKKAISAWRKRGKKIAFTNGCFDILHYGHVAYLQRAKKTDRILIVGLNSDSSVRKIKGAGRPINSQKERAAIVAALGCVDYVAIFYEETPLKMIKELKPDILIKGADWKGKHVVGQNVVSQQGGKLEFVSYLSQYSTTKLIKSIKKSVSNG